MNFLVYLNEVKAASFAYLSHMYIYHRFVVDVMGAGVVFEEEESNTPAP